MVLLVEINFDWKRYSNFLNFQISFTLFQSKVREKIPYYAPLMPYGQVGQSNSLNALSMNSVSPAITFKLQSFSLKLLSNPSISIACFRDASVLHPNIARLFAADVLVGLLL